MSLAIRFVFNRLFRNLYVVIACPAVISFPFIGSRER